MRPSLRILYFGDQEEGCTSRHRSEALRRLGHEVLAFNPKKSLPGGYITPRFNFKTGYVFAVPAVRRSVRAFLAANGSPSFDLLWVDNGEAVSADLIRELRPRVGKVVNYNCDDATGGRDGFRWTTLRRAICEYDLCAVVRAPNVREYPRYGARRIIRVMMSADEVAHAPRSITPELQAKWASDVAFVGTWMPERGPFLLALKRAGIPLAIWGNRWSKAAEWSELRSSWRGGALVGDDYAYAVQCAKINLGLLSKGNRDEHTTRSAEIPSLGSVLCAERTPEHLAFYREGKEAVFWDDAAECARTCLRLLRDSSSRRDIAHAGRERWLTGPLRNEQVLSEILRELKY
jgi:hypothetical protein